MSKSTKLILTEQEEELIRVMRNYRNSYPNGHPQLLNYAIELFQELTDPYN